MESFSLLKRRTTDLLHNVQQNLPSMPMPSVPSVPSATHQKKSSMKGTWERIDAPDVPRSSHSLNIVHGTAYLFGGEIEPRKPVDNDMHVVTLPWSSAGADYFKIKASPAKPDAQPKKPEVESKSKGKQPAGPEKPELGDVPASRVGHATAVIGSRIFLFGGRGGPDMRPLNEGGRVWVFDTRSNTWTYLDPAPVVPGGAIVPQPAPRSYHTATSIDRPRDFAPKRPKEPETWGQWALGDTSKTGIPQAPVVGNVAEDAVDEESDGYGTFFIHAGCLASGERANDIWAFNVHDRTWTELPAAPGPARGGSAICVSKTRLFRFGGFDGQSELGGQLDFLHLEVETFDDRGTKGEVAVRARGGWQTILESDPNADSTEIHAEPAQIWPEPRSVASLEAITSGAGYEYLVLTMGERDPSSEGHEGAGKFLNDVWAFQVPPLGMTAASVTAAMWQAVGRKTGEGKWTKLDLEPYDDDNSDEMPAARGWLASAPMGELEESGILIWGGLGEDNERLGDGWILRVGDS
ncbi:Nitrile-specifier protein 5 [Fusarium odoratissimum]|uniref:Nitrile-specifier protein 5 n=1 Tax=Fusarium oxysporum f. sp. cubense (strain race 4) TaxID=2502994 RepID=N1RCN2_FUSC4|nr:Nitrile-specifier protein 5 [Fusarium odoratissimum]